MRAALDPALGAIAGELARANPELEHVDGTRILFVAGAARRGHRASVRPLRFARGRRSEDGRWWKPEVIIDGRPMLYEICLRPRFFLEGDGETRLTILAHELWHLAPAFDGTLAEERRHHAAPSFDELVDTFVARYRAAGFTSDRALAVEGELELAAWLQRPPSRVAVGVRDRARYDERDLYRAVISQRITRPSPGRSRTGA